MTTREAINRFRTALAEQFTPGETNAMVRIVMDDVMHYSQVDMIIHENDELPDFMPGKLEDIIARLLKGEPLQYILGEARFCGHSFEVTPATLIPRPETEQIVDMICDQNTASDLRVMDVGTGSGCIAISLALAMRFPQVTAIDISTEALAVARRNAEKLKARVKFEQCDILTAKPRPQSLDLLVSNPPYVCRSESAQMQRNVLNYEPGTALWVPDDNPLMFYRAITAYASVALTDGGRIYFEINRRFGNETAQLLRDNGFNDAQVIKDYVGNDRFVTATRH